MFIDLLFANSGIEDEIVRRADRLEVLPDVFMPVASTGHLIALKVLAGRHQDLTDLGYLITAATDADLAEARASVAQIQERGYHRGQNLPEDLSAIISQARKLPAAQVDFAAHGPPGSPRRPGQGTPVPCTSNPVPSPPIPLDPG